MKFSGQSPEAVPSSLPAYFGSRQEIVFLRPGMEMILGNFCLTEQMKFDFYSGDVCEFVFVLSGKFRHRFSGTDERPDISPLSAALWLTPKRKGQHDCFPGSDICFVCVRVRRALLSEIAGDYLLQVPKEFRCILEKREDSLYYRFSKMTVPMQAAARQVFQCPYHGGMRKIFLEGKALELISHLMAYHFGSRFNKKRSLPQGEAKQIECARTILLAHMENPLPLSELARAAGLSETKLTRGFRRVYGSSVFAYLRRHRLEKARMLLESGNFNVTETALASGYSSPSHFTRSFTACYGLNPGEYLSGFKK